MPRHPIYHGFYLTQGGLRPTVVSLKAPMDYAESKLPSLYENWLDKRENSIYIITMPIIGGIPVKKTQGILFRNELKEVIEQQDITKWFANCKNNFEEGINILYPRVIIATEEADKILKDFYLKNEKSIEIGGKTYPYYVMTPETDFTKEITELSRQPYRGILPQRIKYIDNPEPE